MENKDANLYSGQGLSSASSLNTVSVNSIEKNLDDFCKTNCSSFNDYSNWLDLFDKYEKIMSDIETYANSENDDADKIRMNVNRLMVKLDLSYERYNRNFRIWQMNKSKDIEQKIEKQQGLNFTIFSLFMTLITFLLSNVVVIAKTDYSLKTIIVINLILMLVAIFVFMFIGFFMGYVKKDESKRSIFAYWKHIVLCSVFVLVLLALIFVSIFYKN